jgi:uncharacterized RDD family membrane protein YckC
MATESDTPNSQLARGENGVCFEPCQYAGLFRRAIVDLIDLFVLCVVCLAGCLLLPEDDPVGYWVMIWFLTSYVYMAVIKAYGIPTVGYRLGNIQLINLKGSSPSLWQTSLCFLFIVFGPLNYLLDLLWLSGDTAKQAFRDKFAGTLVVRKGAQPLGQGNIVFKRYFFLGYAFLFREVDRKASPTPSIDQSLKAQPRHIHDPDKRCPVSRSLCSPPRIPAPRSPPTRYQKPLDILTTPVYFGSTGTTRPRLCGNDGIAATPPTATALPTASQSAVTFLKTSGR